MKSSAATARAPLMTVGEWGALDEDVEGELVDGKLEEEETPTFLHEVVASWLLGLLLLWARKRRGFVVGAEGKLAVGPARGRKPDVTVFLGKARPRLGDAVARVAPHLVVEVVSPRPRDARRDRVEKLRDYARAGVRYYWLVDPQLRTLEVLALDGQRRYAHALDVSGGRLRRVPGCPGLVLDVDDLWMTIDAAAATEAGRSGATRAKRRSTKKDPARSARG
jgi:Uma2 family endonuclease